MDIENIDPKELAQAVGQAVEAAKRIANTHKVVAAIFERTFDKETLDAIYLVMRGPDAIAEIPPEERMPAIHKACTVIDNYYASMGRLQ